MLSGSGRFTLPYLPGGLRKTADPSVQTRRTAFFSFFFLDFLTIHFFNVFLSTKKNRKSRKTGPMSNSAGGYGGLAEAAGKVRKGNPSGTGDLTQSFRTTPAPRWGTANLNRCARSPYPRGTPQSGLPRSGAGPGSIPAEPGEPRPDPGGTCRKIPKNPSGIRSGRVP